MSDRRLPSDFVILSSKPEDRLKALEHEYNAERAGRLGYLGKAVEASLAKLQSLPARTKPEKREALVWECADAVWQYFLQRELLGLMDHTPVLEVYAIPREVMVKVGIPKPGLPKRG